MTDNFEKKVAVDGPVVNAGELGSSTFSPGQALPAGPLGLGQRWTVARKREVVLRLLRDEPVQLLSRQLGVEIFRLEQWREKAIGGIDASLKQRKGDPVQAELDSAMKRIGGVDHAGGTAGGQDGDLRPFGAAEVAAMSAATSPGTGLAYGLRRVCAAWGMARSSFYAMTSGQHAEPPPAKRRGPKPAISDQALLVAIEADLEASPWEGEGYRKVWARLRVCRDIRVARKRVLRLMRENNLLSPHRCRRRGGNPHDGEIITHAPNLMWGTDGVRVFTVGRRLGLDLHRRRALERRVCRLACLQAWRPLRRLCSRSPWGLPGCMARPRPARLGGWPCGWITAPSICRTTSPTRSSSGASSRPTPSSPSPRPTASPSGSIAR